MKLPDELLDLAHEFGHDVPGLVSGVMLTGADPIQAMRAGSVIVALLQEVKRLRGLVRVLEDEFNPQDVAEAYARAERTESEPEQPDLLGGAA